MCALLDVFRPSRTLASLSFVFQSRLGKVFPSRCAFFAAFSCMHTSVGGHATPPSGVVVICVLVHCCSGLGFLVGHGFTGNSASHVEVWEGLPL